jgi:hypothetical protein
MKAAVGPEGTSWLWTLAFRHHEDRTPTLRGDARGGDGGIREIMATRVKRVRVGAGRGLSMWTTVLAYLILFMGFITFLGGAFGALMLIFEEVAKTGRVPFRYYAMMVGLIATPRYFWNGLGAMSFTWNSPVPKNRQWSVVHTCVSRRKSLLPCREPPWISGWLGGCGKWRQNCRPGRPSKRTNAVLTITSWGMSGPRLGLSLSRSH